VLAAGEVVALDTPAGLIARVGGLVTATFRTAHPDLLRTIPEIASVRVEGAFVTVTGGPSLLKAVATAVPDLDDLRTERTTLDDAFLALTGDES
jgi:ABC-2 type transport system ATP-binding protein